MQFKKLITVINVIKKLTILRP